MGEFNHASGFSQFESFGPKSGGGAGGVVEKNWRL
jgi:hypothetical protein